MGLLDPQRTIFVAIDLQGKLMDAVFRPVALLEGARRFIAMAGLFERPLLLTEQYPKGLGATHSELLEAYDALESPKRRIEKEAFGCCGEPAFETAVAAQLPGVERKGRQFVLGGIEAHVCVLQTALGLIDQGSEVFVAWDCVSSRGEEYYRWALERMSQAGATITNHESIGFELAGDKNHKAFKALSGMLKAGQPDGSS